MLNHIHKAILLVFCLGVLGTFLSSNTFATTYTSSVTTSGNITVNVSTIKGASISTDTVVVNSTCPLGYDLSIAGPSDTTLYKNGDSTSSSYISPSAGTSSSPSPILGTGYLNTWGYSIDANTTINSSTFIGLTNTPASILSKNQASAVGGDTINVHYGVSVESTKEAGTYTMAESTAGAGDNVITYYLTTSLDCTSYQVVFNPTSTAGGSSLSGTGSMTNQRITEGVATSLTSNSYTPPTGYYFGSWNTAQDGTGTTYTNGQSVTDLAAAGQTITLYAQWVECPPNGICYYANGNNVVGTMGVESFTSSDTSVTLLASNFSRESYGFAGWSTDSTVTNASKIYGPQEDMAITAGQYATEGLKLYAVWVASAGSLQDDAISVCAGLTTAPTDGTANLSSVSALTDRRDGDTYAIAKLADGKCWMIENLRLEATATRGNNQFDSSITNESLAQGYSKSTTYGNFSGLADAESTNFSTSVTANSLYYSGTQSGTATIDISAANYPAYRMPRYNNLNTQSRASNPTSNAFTNNNTAGGMYSYGNYYTWQAALADLNYISSGNNTNITDTSLCPTGWRLPQGGDKTRITSNDDNDFWNLTVDALNGSINPANYSSDTAPYYTGKSEAGPVSSKLRSYPNNFLYSGYFNESSARDRGSYGYYWSSTHAKYYNVSYELTLYGSYVYPGTGSGTKYKGHSIRCIASVPQPTSTPADSIGYYPNNTNVEGTMGLQSITSSDTSATLLASNFSKDGYGFAGWSDVPDYYTNQNAHFYGPQEDISFTAGQYSTNGLSLYAVWIKSEGNLQDATKVAQLCGTGTGSLTQAPTDGTANLTSVSALTDQRDGQTYAIAKLADGKCWMVENLRLEANDTKGQNRFDNSITNQSLAQGYGTSTTYGNFSGLADAETPDKITDTYIANSLYSNDGSNNTINIGTSNDPAYRMPRYNNINTPAAASDRPQNPTTGYAYNSTSKAGMYSYGNYYTWHAAIADLAPNTTKDQSTASTSLCPAGWHLPTGGLAYASGSSSGVNVTGDTNTFRDFYNLSYKIMDEVKTAYEDTPHYGNAHYTSNTTNASGNTADRAFRSYPNNFVYAGYIVGQLTLRSSYAFYWSSTANSSDDANYLLLHSSGVYPGTTFTSKSSGFTVRCVTDLTPQDP